MVFIVVIIILFIVIIIQNLSNHSNKVLYTK